MEKRETADIFVSYRRNDSEWAAGRIGDRLAAEIGDKRVFFDTLTIQPGENFVDAIGEHVEQCRVLLAIIGSKWISELKARESEPNDFVRIEISEALSRGIRVVPVIIGDIPFPKVDELPPELESIVQLNAVQVRAQSFKADMAPLVSFLTELLERSKSIGGEGMPKASKNESGGPTGESIQLTHRTEFWKTGEDGRPRYRIFVRLDGSDEAIKSVEKVIYTLHPTFRNPVREVIDSRNNFELRTNGWGEFEIKAAVQFKHWSQGLNLRRQITFE